MGQHMVLATSSTLERPIDPHSLEYNNISLEQNVTLQFPARVCVVCFLRAADIMIGGNTMMP